MKSLFAVHLQDRYEDVIHKLEGKLTQDDLSAIGVMCELAIELVKVVPPHIVTEALLVVKSRSNTVTVLEKAMGKD